MQKQIYSCDLGKENQYSYSNYLANYPHLQSNNDNQEKECEGCLLLTPELVNKDNTRA